MIMTKIKKYIEEYIENTLLSIVQDVVKKELKKYRNYNKPSDILNKIPTISVKKLNEESQKNLIYMRIYRLVKKIVSQNLNINDVRKLSQGELDMLRDYVIKHPEYKSNKTIKKLLSKTTY